jgi:hypothetical protein
VTTKNVPENLRRTPQPSLRDWTEVVVVIVGSDSNSGRDAIIDVHWLLAPLPASLKILIVAMSGSVEPSNETIWARVDYVGADGETDGLPGLVNALRR